MPWQIPSKAVLLRVYHHPLKQCSYQFLTFLLTRFNERRVNAVFLSPEGLNSSKDIPNAYFRIFVYLRFSEIADSSDRSYTEGFYTRLPVKFIPSWTIAFCLTTKQT